MLIAALIVEMVFPAGKPTSIDQALRALGLGAPSWPALASAMLAGVLLLVLMRLYATATNTTITVRPDAPWLGVGMFAQGGVAEEVVFRGFLFRRLRLTRSFWRAAGLAAIPFVVVHSILFLTLDFVVALSSLILSLLISFPLAWLFERAGNSVWPPALVHAVIQGAIKVVEAEPSRFQGLALFWMGVSAAVPYLFFFLRPSAGTTAPR